MFDNDFFDLFGDDSLLERALELEILGLHEEEDEKDLSEAFLEEDEDDDLSDASDKLDDGFDDAT